MKNRVENGSLKRNVPDLLIKMGCYGDVVIVSEWVEQGRDYYLPLARNAWVSQ